MVCITIQLAELVDSILALVFILISWRVGTLEVKKIGKGGTLKVKKSKKSSYKRKK